MLSIIRLFLPRKRLQFLAFLFFSNPFIGYAYSYTSTLSLYEAESLAISNAPELKQLQANSASLEQQAISDGQLPDPQLIAGVVNVPSNSFSFNQDDMTMKQIGLQQSFAPGHSLAIKSKKTKALAKAEHRKLHEQAAMLLRNVRETWLDIYYWKQAANIIQKNQLLYRQLLKTTESQYSTGKSNQSELLQLQVEYTRLSDQRVQIQQKIDVLRAQLGRWIGEDQAQRPLSNSLPRWPKPLPINILRDRLCHHPLLEVDAANIEAARDEVAFAREQYKPGIMFDVDYGIRQGRMNDGTPRSNMISAGVTVDLPIFTSQRQDKRLQVSAYQLEATELSRDIHYRDLLKELSAQYAMWRSYSKRENLYRRHLGLEAKQNSKAALLAYQNSTTDLSLVFRAYSNELTIRLEQMQIQIEQAKARAALLYLEGVT